MHWLQTFVTAAACLSRYVSLLPTVSFLWPKTHVCASNEWVPQVRQRCTTHTIHVFCSLNQVYSAKECFHNFKWLTSAEICRVDWFNQTHTCIPGDSNPVRAESLVTDPHVLNLQWVGGRPRTLTLLTNNYLGSSCIISEPVWKDKGPPWHSSSDYPHLKSLVIGGWKVDSQPSFLLKLVRNFSIMSNVNISPTH